jgi:acetylornithine/N-succinyldiaminopimelate aminotransferase
MSSWHERADRVLFQTYGRFPLTLVKGEGYYVHDDEDQAYLDLVAGLAVCNVGHCHPKVIQAIEAQCKRLIHVSNLYYTQPQVELAERLVSETFADRVFFCNSGAEANEGALKLVRKVAKDRGYPERFEVITMQGSFHGRTLAMVAATAQEKYQKGFDPLVSGFKYVPFGDLQAVQEAVNEHTCAVMVEPIQGEGGVNCPPEGYLKGLKAFCDKQGILLIMDEVQTGMGRTGTLLAHQSEGVTPHIMTVAKGLAGGLPMGALMASEDLAGAFTPGTHASTFGGNPVAAAAGIAVLSILLDDGVLEAMTPVARCFRDGLEEIAKRYTQVREVRGRGWMLGMELETAGNPIVQACMKRGMLVNCTVDRVLRFIPPLTITMEAAQEALGILGQAFHEVMG